MALADWYELVHTQEADGQNVLNVYHLLRDNPGVDAQVVAEAFNDSILPALSGLQYTGVNNIEISARNLDVPADFFVRTPSIGAGVRVGANFSQFTSMSMQFNRTRTDMKNGQKRFIAGVEADTNGALWLAPIIAEGVTLATAILAAWEIGGSPGIAQCRFGVLQRICSTTPSPPCVGGYRLPEIDDEVEFFLPLTAIVRGTVRSQTSRKRLI